MKKISFVLLIVFISFSLCGCWSSEEPKDLAIINSVIYDCDEEGNYYVSVQIINTSSIVSSGASTTGEKNPSIVIKGKGTSLSQAFDDLTGRIEKSLFAAHNKVRFISERMIRNKHHFQKLLDFIFRDTLTDETSLLTVISDEDLDKVYKSTIGLASLTGSFVEQLHVKNQEQSSCAVFYRTFEFVREYYEEGIDPVLGRILFSPTVEMPSLNPGGDNKEAKYEMKTEGMAIFKDLQFVGYAGKFDTEVYNVLINNARVVLVELFEEGDLVSLTLYKPKSDIKVSKNGEQIDVDIKVSGEMSLSNFFVEGNSDENYKDRVKEVKKVANEFLAQKTTESIKNIMLLGSDIYGFGRALHNSSPSDWREVSQDWENYFKNANVKVEYNLVLSREGEINTPFI